MRLNTHSTTAARAVVLENTNDIIFSSGKRIYSAQPATFSRKPWTYFQNKIHSTWGDLREKIGLASKVRQFRNNLPKLLQGEDSEKLNAFLKHLEKTGEYTLHAALQPHLARMDASRQSRLAQEAVDNKFQEMQQAIRRDPRNQPGVARLKCEFLQCVSEHASKLIADPRYLRAARNYLDQFKSTDYAHLDATQKQFVVDLDSGGLIPNSFPAKSVSSTIT